MANFRISPASPLAMATSGPSPPSSTSEEITDSSPSFMRLMSALVEVSARSSFHRDSKTSNALYDRSRTHVLIPEFFRIMVFAIGEGESRLITAPRRSS